MEDDLFGKRGIATTEVGGIVQAQPPPSGQFALPVKESLRSHVLLADAAMTTQVCEFADQVVLEPSPHLVGELLLGGAPGEIHDLTVVVHPRNLTVRQMIYRM